MVLKIVFIEYSVSQFLKLQKSQTGPCSEAHALYLMRASDWYENAWYEHARRI